MTAILVTGGAGFIGSNFVRQWLEEEKTAVVNLDKLTYAGNLDSLADVMNDPLHVFVEGDIADGPLLSRLLAEHRVRAVVNFAAESHVDRSIDRPAAFVETNVVGTFRLLEAVRAYCCRLPEPRRRQFRFLHVSTDEVYGSLGPTGRFTEQTPLAPNSPYSASKASADLLVQAYHETFGLPTLITRCSNNYGPYQFPEKLIPLFVTNLLEGRKVPLYGDGLNVRDWIHVTDHCEAIVTVMERGKPGQVYNIGGECELPNIEIARRILSHLGHDESSIEYVKDRPGHDRRYAMDIARVATELGWQPRIEFGHGLAETIEWYMANEAWWRRIKTGEYLTYYEKQYGSGGVVGQAR